MVKISRWPPSASGRNFWYHARHSSLAVIFLERSSKSARLANVASKTSV
jgi:hypothetical protein